MVYKQILRLSDAERATSPAQIRPSVCSPNPKEALIKKDPLHEPIVPKLILTPEQSLALMIPGQTAEDYYKEKARALIGLYEQIGFGLDMLAIQKIVSNPIYEGTLEDRVHRAVDLHERIRALWQGFEKMVKTVPMNDVSSKADSKSVSPKDAIHHILGYPSRYDQIWDPDEYF